MRCVDGCMVFGFRSDRLSARIPNELIAEFVLKNPQRLIGVAGIDPMSADALLRRNLLIYGAGGIVVPFVGIKLIDVVVTALRLA